LSSMPRLLNLKDPCDCSIVQRLNRFVVEVSTDGLRARAWINNTGRLSEFMVPGRRAFCLRRESPGKTTHRLFAIHEGGLGALIDTQFQMRAFEICLRHGLLPWLVGTESFKRNARLGSSLIDYWLPQAELYLEVKSAVLRGSTFAMYPDCPSVRGRKHIRELTSHARRGGRACILFVAALPKVKAFRPNPEADPELASLLEHANETGVQVRAVAMLYHPGMHAVLLSNPDLPVSLDGRDKCSS